MKHQYFNIIIGAYIDLILNSLLTSPFFFSFLSDWGAQQISVDFTSLRHWISKNPNLKEDSRRYLLLLDSIRQCEGVAKLLQSKPGEVLDIRPAKNKVAPITGMENQTIQKLDGFQMSPI
jgi:hypothetical protein